LFSEPTQKRGIFCYEVGCVECECVSPKGRKWSVLFFALLSLSEYFDTSNDLYKAR